MQGHALLEALDKYLSQAWQNWLEFNMVTIFCLAKTVQKFLPEISEADLGLLQHPR